MFLIQYLSYKGLHGTHCPWLYQWLEQELYAPKQHLFVRSLRFIQLSFSSTKRAVYVAGIEQALSVFLKGKAFVFQTKKNDSTNFQSFVLSQQQNYNHCVDGIWFYRAVKVPNSPPQIFYIKPI